MCLGWVSLYVCWLILGQLEPMGHGNTLIMNIQAQPLEETAARVMSHVLTVVRGHFLGLHIKKRGAWRRYTLAVFLFVIFFYVFVLELIKSISSGYWICSIAPLSFNKRHNMCTVACRLNWENMNILYIWQKLRESSFDTAHPKIK